MSKVLIVADHFDGQLLSSTSKAVNCGSQISEDLDVLVLEKGSEIASQAAAIDSVKNILSINNEAFENPIAAIMAPVVAEVADGYDYILLPSTTFGRDLAPRISAILDVNQVTDIMSVEGPRTFKRPIYAGNAIQTIKISDGQKIEFDQFYEPQNDPVGFSIVVGNALPEEPVNLLIPKEVLFALSHDNNWEIN